MITIYARAFLYCRPLADFCLWWLPPVWWEFSVLLLLLIFCLPHLLSWCQTWSFLSCLQERWQLPYLNTYITLIERGNRYVRKAGLLNTIIVADILPFSSSVLMSDMIFSFMSARKMTVARLQYIYNSDRKMEQICKKGRSVQYYYCCWYLTFIIFCPDVRHDLFFHVCKKDDSCQTSRYI